MKKTDNADNKQNTTGHLSIEKLFHFNCCFCSKWWSIGDPEKNRTQWFCPWCGAKQSFSEIKGKT